MPCAGSASKVVPTMPEPGFPHRPQARGGHRSRQGYGTGCRRDAVGDTGPVGHGRRPVPDILGRDGSHNQMTEGGQDVLAHDARIDLLDVKLPAPIRATRRDALSCKALSSAKIRCSSHALSDPYYPFNTLRISLRNCGTVSDSNQACLFNQPIFLGEEWGSGKYRGSYLSRCRTVSASVGQRSFR